MRLQRDLLALAEIEYLWLNKFSSSTEVIRNIIVSERELFSLFSRKSYLNTNTSWQTRINTIMKPGGWNNVATLNVFSIRNGIQTATISLKQFKVQRMNGKTQCFVFFQSWNEHYLYRFVKWHQTLYRLFKCWSVKQTLILK